VGDARKAAGFVLIVLMPIAAIAVSGAGWIGRAMVERGILGADIEAKHAFVAVADHVLMPGLFGFVVAALVAALMSTADTLINAIATISVVDLWRPARQARTGKPPGERAEMRAARVLSATATIVGLALVPVFATFQSIYRAHGAFTAAVTPPLAVALVMAFTWRRFSARAALVVMIGGIAAIALSFVFPGLIAPFAHGIDLEAGTKSYSYIRALYGFAVCIALGVGASLVWPSRSTVPPLLVIGPVIDKIRAFKGGEPKTDDAPAGHLTIGPAAEAIDEGARDTSCVLSRADAERLRIDEGDVVSVRATGWFSGGFQAQSGAARIEEIPEGTARIAAASMRRLSLGEGERVRVKRIH
jgi:SSS family solute:Na+ symporter